MLHERAGPEHVVPATVAGLLMLMIVPPSHDTARVFPDIPHGSFPDGPGSSGPLGSGLIDSISLARLCVRVCCNMGRSLFVSGRFVACRLAAALIERILARFLVVLLGKCRSRLNSFGHRLVFRSRLELPEQLQKMLLPAQNMTENVQRFEAEILIVRLLKVLYHRGHGGPTDPDQRREDRKVIRAAVEY